MAALSQHTSHGVRQAINKLNERMYDLFTLDVAPREIFEYMVSNEDRVILNAAAKMGLRSATWSSSATITHHDMKLDFSLATLKLPMPSDLIEKKHPLDPQAPYAPRIIEYLEKMRTIAVQFATARAIFETLDLLCRSPKQLRFFMPSIIPLLKIVNQNELANELAATPIVRNPPNLPFGSRQALIDTNALIAKAVLLPERDRHQNYHKQFALSFDDSFKPSWQGGVRAEMMSW